MGEGEDAAADLAGVVGVAGAEVGIAGVVVVTGERGPLLTWSMTP